MSEPFIVAQISDPHIALSGDKTTGEAELERAVDHLLHLPSRPDLVLVTGDCTDHGQPDEYARFRDLLRPLPMPVYVIPGNHDHRERLLDTFGPQGENPLPGFAQYVVGGGPLRLIALDTLVPGRDEGQLCPERLAWLDARLTGAPDQPTVVFMHHPPFQTGVPVCDAIGLGNAEPFGALVARHPQIEAVLTGHLHFSAARRFRGTLAISCGSTQHQLMPDLRRPVGFAVRSEAPSCLLHAWHPHVGLVTHTSLIGERGPVNLIHDGEDWVG